MSNHRSEWEKRLSGSPFIKEGYSSQISEKVDQYKKKHFVYAIISCLLASITGLLGVVNWFMLRELLYVILPFTSFNEGSWLFIDMLSFLLLGILWLNLVYLSQHYYLKGARKGVIWQYFQLVTGVQLMLLLICYALPLVLEGTKILLVHGMIITCCLLLSLFMIFISLRKILTK